MATPRLISHLGAGRVTIVQTPEQDTFTFSVKAAEYFVIATPIFPGWIVDLDGHPVSVMQMLGGLPAIKVGPGTHTLSYVYAPLSISIGALVSTERVF